MYGGSTLPQWFHQAKWTQKKSIDYLEIEMRLNIGLTEISASVLSSGLGPGQAQKYASKMMQYRSALITPIGLQRCIQMPFLSSIEEQQESRSRDWHLHLQREHSLTKIMVRSSSEDVMSTLWSSSCVNCMTILLSAIRTSVQPNDMRQQYSHQPRSRTDSVQWHTPKTW